MRLMIPQLNEFGVATASEAATCRRTPKRLRVYSCAFVVRRRKKEQANRNCRGASSVSPCNAGAMKNGSNILIIDAAPPRAADTAATTVAAAKRPSRKPRKRDHVFTLGIEEEFQIIDPQTRALRSHIQEILADGKIVLKERLKPELHQSQVELDTDVCNNAREARRQVVDLRSELA